VEVDGDYPTKYINGTASTTKEISNDEIKPMRVSARDLREWNFSNL
jgi:hypothetical protein